MRGGAGVCRRLWLLLLVCWSHLKSVSTSASLHQKHTTTLDENVEAYLLFNAPASSQNCSYRLFNSGVIFNNNGTEIFSHTYPYEKLLRTSVHIQFAFGYLTVSLSIENLQRGDKGKYQCRFTCPNSPSERIQTTHLIIYHPPTEVDCSWVDQDLVALEAANYFNLSVLQCSAINGYPTSNVICFSNTDDITLVHTPLHVTGHHVFTATFWLDKHQDLDCCSVSSKFTKSIQDCNDYHSGHHTSYVKTTTTESLQTVSTAADAIAPREQTSRADISTTKGTPFEVEDSKDCTFDLFSSNRLYHIATITLALACGALVILANTH